MPTIRVVVGSRISPDQVLAAAHDFSERRAQVFPAVSVEHMTVHGLGETWADVTEGTPAGFGINWERCRYDWSEPGTVTATVTDSNVYAFPGSSWELKTSASDGGSRVQMTWVRKFQHGFRARFWGTLFAIAGKPIFGKYARDVITNLERQDGAGARSN
jgi:hypothetical protein